MDPPLHRSGSAAIGPPAGHSQSAANPVVRPYRGPAPAPPRRRLGFVWASGALCDDVTTLTPEDGGGGGAGGRGSRGSRGLGPERVSKAAETPKSPPTPRGEAARPRATARWAGGADSYGHGCFWHSGPARFILSPKSSARARGARAYRTGEQPSRWLGQGPWCPRTAVSYGRETCCCAG